MSSIVERYDRDAEEYEQYWAPVLDASARGSLTRLAELREPAIGDSPDIVDVGTGTGVLAFEARRRWPQARITGVDPSLGMLSMAARRATAATHPGRRSRVPMAGRVGRVDTRAGRGR